MPSTFSRVKPQSLADNPFKAIGSDWMLITAGDIESYNMMTASWGALGVLWNKNIAICFVRPQRFTFQFLERSSHHTLCFFPSRLRKVLSYCGTHSGREVNKMAVTGLTPIAGEKGTVHFAEARLVIVCRKIYIQDLNPRGFLAPEIDEEYPDEDYHRVYVGEIDACLRRQA
jgi:flavin reductase (DIM6/NTAB) family NADH-FMN oxidoreductase RutF